MDTKELAMKLNLNSYTKEVSGELEVQAEDAGLVVVFGASDDLMEFRGAIRDETGCYDGGYAYLDGLGLISSDCMDDECPYFAEIKKKAIKIKGIWCNGEYSWLYETDIPHETFIIMEDNEKYCKGIVFCMDDLRKLYETKNT